MGERCVCRHMPVSKLIAEAFSTIPCIQAVYLLGSAASGAMRSDSDVDIALLFKPGSEIDADFLDKKKAELSLMLGREVDTGYMSTKNLVYARQAILTGKRIFVQDENFVNMREATLLGLYAQFENDRQEVMNAYKA